jgi:hypothetical protein
MSTVLPNNILMRLRPEDRAKLGKAGMTAEEAEAAFVAKNESELQSIIQTTLQRHGIFVIRNRMDKRPTVAVGVPDLLFSINGQAVAWEVKMPGRKPTQEQVEAMDWMKRNGWEVSVIRSYDEALKEYARLTTIQPADEAGKV